MTLITRTISRFMFPVILTFAAYLALHGHVSPGGGFPAGVVAASAFAALMINFGRAYELKSFRTSFTVLFESVFGFLVFSTVLVGFVFKAVKFEAAGISLPGLGLTTIFSNLAGAVIVASALFLILDSMLLERGRYD